MYISTAKSSYVLKVDIKRKFQNISTIYFSLNNPSLFFSIIAIKYTQSRWVIFLSSIYASKQSCTYFGLKGGIIMIPIQLQLRRYCTYIYYFASSVVVSKFRMSILFFIHQNYCFILSIHLLYPRISCNSVRVRKWTIRKLCSCWRVEWRFKTSRGRLSCGW